MANRRILIVDDDPEICNAYQAVLAPEQSGKSSTWAKISGLLSDEPELEVEQELEFQLSFASQGQKGFLLVQQALEDNTPFALACIDIRMPPGWDGMQTAARIRRIDPNIELVIITAYADRSLEEIVKAVGAPDKLLFLRKPFDPEELKQIALALTQKWNLARLQEIQARKLRASEARFRALVETSSDWVWETDQEGLLLYGSPVCETIYGFRPEELVGKYFFDLLQSPEDRAEFKFFFKQCVYEKTGFHNIERQCLTKNGRIVYVESSAVPWMNDQGRVLGFRGIDRDITARKENEQKRIMLEEQYRQSQKMEALGTLSGGIAHDFNNILTPIMGNAQLSLLALEEDSPIYENLANINESAQKGAELIRRILAFSRKQFLPSRALNLNEVICEINKLLERLVRENITITLDLADDLWMTHGEPNQLEQVLINLVVNAQDAISGSGTITIRTRNTTVAAEDFFDISHNPISGSFVEVSVRDTGAGMDQVTAGHIFEPFYTTKDVGKGTGLGLSTVYGIVNQHCGHLRLDTEPGRGTTFFIYLQKSTRDTRVETDDQDLSEPAGQETILVAEDDPEVRSVVRSILQHYGYHVLDAANGREAVDIFEDLEGRVDLFLTDLVMPELGGEDAARALRTRRPDLPVIFTSGHPFGTLPVDLGAGSGTEILPKPFTPRVLATMIRRTLDGKNKGNDRCPVDTTE